LQIPDYCDIIDCNGRQTLYITMIRSLIERKNIMAKRPSGGNRPRDGRGGGTGVGGGRRGGVNTGGCAGGGPGHGAGGGRGKGTGRPK